MTTTSISRRGLLQAGSTAVAGMSVLQISGPAEALGTGSPTRCPGFATTGIHPRLTLATRMTK